jgi:hypothetical protein
MTIAEEARDSVLRLAGRTAFWDKARAPALSDLEQAELYVRLAAAKQTAQLTTRAFLALDDTSLIAFCERFALTRAEVRLGQRMIQLLWSMWRVSKTARHVVRERHGRLLQ